MASHVGSLKSGGRHRQAALVRFHHRDGGGQFDHQERVATLAREKGEDRVQRDGTVVVEDLARPLEACIERFVLLGRDLLLGMSGELRDGVGDEGFGVGRFLSAGVGRGLRAHRRARVHGDGTARQ